MDAFEKRRVSLASMNTSFTTTSIPSFRNLVSIFVIFGALVGKTSAHGNHNKMVIPEGQAISDDPIVSVFLFSLGFGFGFGQGREKEMVGYRGGGEGKGEWILDGVLIIEFRIQYYGHIF